MSAKKKGDPDPPFDIRVVESIDCPTPPLFRGDPLEVTTYTPKGTMPSLERFGKLRVVDALELLECIATLVWSGGLGAVGTVAEHKVGSLLAKCKSLKASAKRALLASTGRTRVSSTSTTLSSSVLRFLMDAARI